MPVPCDVFGFGAVVIGGYFIASFIRLRNRTNTANASRGRGMARGR